MKKVTLFSALVLSVFTLTVLFASKGTSSDKLFNFITGPCSDGDILVWNGTGNYFECRASGQGAWTSVAYDSSNFSAAGSMTWTVEEGDIYTYAYSISGKTMTVAAETWGTTIGGTVSQYLKIKIPNNQVAKKGTRTTLITRNSGLQIGYAYVLPNSNWIEIARNADTTNWILNTNDTGLGFNLTFEIE